MGQGEKAQEAYSLEIRAEETGAGFWPKAFRADPEGDWGSAVTPQNSPAGEGMARQEECLSMSLPPQSHLTLQKGVH